MERIDLGDGFFIRMTHSEAEQHCKFGQGESCCAFVSMSGGVGFGCCRMTPLATEINERLNSGLMKAKGPGGWSGCYWEEKPH
jgi:hypothetical protein